MSRSRCSPHDGFGYVFGSQGLHIFIALRLRSLGIAVHAATGICLCPAMDPRLITCPLPRAIMPGTTVLVTYSRPLTLVWIISSQFLTSSSYILVSAAFLIRTSMQFHASGQSMDCALTFILKRETHVFHPRRFIIRLQKCTKTATLRVAVLESMVICQGYCGAALVIGAVLAAGVLVCTPIASPETTKFTRRFCCLPAAVPLSATKLVAP